MDLRSMQALIWMLLLGFLIFVPGSTLNAIESTAVTAAAAATTPKTETPSIGATPTTTTTTKTTTTTVTTTAQSKATSTAPTLLKDTTVLRTHSITQAAIPTTTTTIQATTPTTAAASSITIITKSGAEFAGRKSATLASAAFVIKATTTTTTATTTAVSPATGSSLTRNATNDRSPTTIGTKASLNSSATSAGSSNSSSSNNNIRSHSSPSGRAQVVTGIVGPGAEGGAKSQTLTATAAKAATPTTITASTAVPTTTTDASTTIESLAAAAAAQLVATQMPPKANNEETESQRVGNTNTYAAAATIAANNNDYNKGTNYYRNNGNAVDAQALSRGTASAPHQVRPLQRPKIDNSNNYNYNNSYSYNRNDLAYMREQQQLYAALQRQQQQQYAQQLVQLPPDGHNFAANGSSGIVAIDTAAVDSNLVIDDRNFQQDKRLHNQSMATFASNLYERAPTTTTAATGSANNLVDVAAAAAASPATGSTTAASTTTTTTAATTTRRPRATTTPKPAPIIDDYQTIISQAGTHAYLPCNVKQLVKKPISWLRMRDGHILTVDQTTFIADQRFQSIYASNPERWSLQIKYVQLKDAGTYECQVSTEPKASAIVTLRIVEPKTELIGEPTRHVKAGSQVKLRCIISQALEPPLFINWFYNQKQIYLHNRKGWRTEIERIELPPDMPTTTTTTSTTTTSATTTTTTTTAAAATTTMSLTTSSSGDAVDVAATMAAAAAATAAATHSAGSSTSLAAGSSGAGVAALGGNSAVAATEMSTTLPAITKTTTATTSTAATTPTTTVAATSTSAMTPTTTTMTVAEVKQITTASLIILAVEKQDSGNYTCSPSNSAPKTVVLHVLNGEYSASAITSGVSGNIIIGNRSKLHCGNMLAILTLLWLIEFVLVEQIWKWQRQQCSNAATNAAAAATAIAAIRWNNEPPTTTMHREWNNCGTSNSRRHIRLLQIVASARNNCHSHNHSYSDYSDWNTNCIGSTARSQCAAVHVSSIVSGSGNLQPWPINTNTHTLAAQEKT